MNESNQTRKRILADRYELGEFIGQGGMATVYRGVDTKLGRQVAVKVMKADLAGDDVFRERFRQEAQAAARMTHPTIVRVLDAGADLIQTAAGAKQLPFIVMEYVDGRNLRQHLAEHRVSINEAYRIVNSVLTALEYSHRAGIVHRDIKPGNIMISSTGRVKVMDFGIARAVSDTSSTLSQTTQILGTAAYFSPEQAKGEKVDARTDLYAVGVLLYELLAGTVPFKGDSAVAVAYQHVSERPVPPQQHNPDVSDYLNQVVLHALTKDKNRRFQNAAEFKEALDKAMRGEDPGVGSQDATTVLPSSDVADVDLQMRRLTRPQRNSARPSKNVIWGAVALVTVLVASVLFWAFNFAPKDLFPTNSRTIPDVVNMEQAQASSAIEDLDLIVVPAEEYSDEVGIGKVTRTDPAVGEEVTKGDTVTVYVSKGPDGFEVPDLEGALLSDAEKQLKELEISIGTVTKVDDPTAQADRILSITPKPGTFVKRGSNVSVEISSGQVEIPDVKGQSLAAARALLNGLGLNVEPKPLGCAITSDSLPVVEQTLVGKQAQRSTVGISYCSGPPASSEND